MKKIALLFFIIAFSLTPLFFVSSEGIKDVSTEELKAMLEGDKAPLVVDTRTPFEYKEGHIPKAINIPQGKFEIIDQLLPKEKDHPLVFYCRGYG